MKLSVLTTSLSRNAGGLYMSVRRLTQSIENGEVTCRVLGIEDEYTLEDLQTWEPLNVNSYSRNGPSFFPTSRSMREAVLQSKLDIIHCHGIWLYPSLIDLAVNRKMNIPYIVSPRGMLDPWALKNSAWKKKLAGWLFENRHLKNAACIHALCESEAESIRAYGLKNPIAIIPNGVDLPDINRVSKKRSEQKEKKRLLFLARIHPKKGLSELIQAWAQIKPADWELLIAGWDDGGHEVRLKKQIADLGLGNSVLCLGPKFGEEKDKLLRSVDAFVLPSFSEGLPMTILEAWAYGIPVLMTPQCNLPEGFQEHASFRIDPQIKPMCKGLKIFFKMNVRQLKQMGCNGINLVQRQFTWPKVAKQMIGVYKWILSRGPKPDCIRLD